MDAFIQYGIVAGVQAMQDSGLEITEENATRIGAAIGSGIGGLGLIEENHTSLMNGGPRKISPFFVPSTIVNMVAGHLTIMFGLRGPSISIATACTSGVHNIGGPRVSLRTAMQMLWLRAVLKSQYPIGCWWLWCSACAFYP